MTVADFRPISLLNNAIKFIIKIVANKLQCVIPSLVTKINMVLWNKFCSLGSRICSHVSSVKKKEIIILKLDFEKAFNRIEHTPMLYIMQNKGFHDRWLIGWKWSSTLKHPHLFVVLNGIPGKVSYRKRGVRQGDPLSPLLFALCADLLQYVLNSTVK